MLGIEQEALALDLGMGSKENFFTGTKGCDWLFVVTKNLKY